MLFEHIVKDDRSLVELLDCDYTFLNERLAKYYGIEGVKGDEMRRVTLPPGSPRGGVLTQGTVLTVTSNPDRTSPVKRGLFILENILGTPPASAAARYPAAGRRRQEARRARRRPCASRWPCTARLPRARRATTGWTRSGWRSRTSTRWGAGGTRNAASRSTRRAGWSPASRSPAIKELKQILVDRASPRFLPLPEREDAHLRTRARARLS